MADARVPSVDSKERQRLANATTLLVLKRQDPYVERIFWSAPHVVVYELVTYADGDVKWRHKDVQGALHIIQRSQPPFFRLLVMNRKGRDNLVDDLIPGQFEFELNNGMIMYRTASCNVHGIWFYDGSDTQRVESLFEEIATGQIPRDVQYVDSTSLHDPHATAAQDNRLVSNEQERPFESEQTDGLERFFPGLSAGSPKPAMPVVSAGVTVPLDSAVQPAALAPARDMAANGGVHVRSSPEASPEELLQLDSTNDGAFLLNLLNGSITAGGGATFSSDAAGKAEDGAKLPHDSAIVAQSMVPPKTGTTSTPQQPSSALPTTGTAVPSLGPDESELVSLLNKVDVSHDSREERLSASTLRALLRRMLEDERYFNRVYQEYIADS